MRLLMQRGADASAPTAWVHERPPVQVQRQGCVAAAAADTGVTTQHLSGGLGVLRFYQRGYT